MKKASVIWLNFHFKAVCGLYISLLCWLVRIRKKVVEDALSKTRRTTLYQHKVIFQNTSICATVHLFIVSTFDLVLDDFYLNITFGGSTKFVKIDQLGINWSFGEEKNYFEIHFHLS